MMRRATIAALGAIAVVACFRPTGAALDGRWAPTSARLGGKDFPIGNFAGATLRLAAGTYAFGGDSGTVTVVSTKPPAQMDIHGVHGPNAGRSIPAIFAVAGDQLTICYQLGAGPRPTDFSSSPGSQLLLIHYRRVE